MTMWKPNTESVLKSELDRYKTISDQFLFYLDKQIDICTTWGNAVKPHETSIEADQFRIRARTLKQVKEKYLHYLTINLNESKG